MAREAKPLLSGKAISTGSPSTVTMAERRPWFASKLAALRAVLILESPAAFRARNLFVSENALTRA